MEDATTPPFPPDSPPVGTTTTQTRIETVAVGKIKPDESHFCSLSVRAILAILVLGTVCYMSIMKIKIEEPMYTLSVAIASFFFAQQGKPKSQTQ